MKILHFMVFILLINIGCNKNNLPASQSSTQTQKPKHEMIFLTGKIDKNNDLTNLDIKIADGKIKLVEPPRNEKIGDIIIHQMDKKNKILATHSIENPMYKAYEYVNEDGGLEKKMIELEESEFFIRIQKIPNSCYLKIFRKNENQKSNETIKNICNENK